MAKLTATQFKEKFGAAVVQATEGTGLFPSVKLAQMALESGWKDAAPGNANFGIKADSSWKGKVISSTTREVIGGVSKTFSGTGQIYASRSEAITAGANTVTLFRAYDTVADSIFDHTMFLKKNARYAKVFTATTPEAQAQELKNAGYATATNYPATLMSIINSYNFKIFDTLKKK